MTYININEFHVWRKMLSIYKHNVLFYKNHRFILNLKLPSHTKPETIFDNSGYELVFSS